MRRTQWTDIGRIFYYDRRLRAAAISFTVSSLSIALLERFTSWEQTFLHCLFLFILCCLSSGYQYYKFSLQACALGLATGSSVVCGIYYGHTSQYAAFCRYAYIFSVFHASEFFMTAITNNEGLKADSFLLNHSKAYWMAASLSWLEFSIEAYFFPEFYSNVVSYCGLALCLLGEAARKLAMFHASNGFTHQIRIRKHNNHVLVTNGIYSLVRHPGYLGWLLWSVGTQLILCNPLCVIVYAYVTFHFFDDRIYEEERYLIEFFGQRYVHYQHRVPTGIPGIAGYRL
jgi:protein-S-isoprenylcysteine O-methyltransferase